MVVIHLQGTIGVSRKKDAFGRGKIIRIHLVTWNLENRKDLPHGMSNTGFPMSRNSMKDATITKVLRSVFRHASGWFLNDNV